MNSLCFRTPLFPRHARLAVLAGGLLGAACVLAAPAGPMADAQARYRQDMAQCNSNASREDVTACRKEARSALAEARRKGLPAPTPDQYQNNMLARCSVHKDAGDRQACEARMHGEGSVEGSVEGGGMLREIETPMPDE